MNDARQTEVRPFPFLLYLDATKFVFVFLLIQRRFPRRFGQNHSPRLQTGQLWLTCFAQNCRCLFSLLITDNTSRDFLKYLKLYGCKINFRKDFLIALTTIYLKKRKISIGNILYFSRRLLSKSKWFPVKYCLDYSSAG